MLSTLLDVMLAVVGALEVNHHFHDTGLSMAYIIAIGLCRHRS